MSTEDKKMKENVLITGASSGLGKQMAMEFASRGYNLALTARREEVLVSVKQEIEQTYKVKVFIGVLDVLDFEQTKKVFAAAAAELGGIDKIIANAGVGYDDFIGSVDAFKNARAMIDTNVTGAIATVEAAVLLFRRQNRGHIITVSSVASFRGFPGSSAYSASKSAISTYSEALRAETYKENIDVTVLSPGYIDTPINQHVSSRPFLIDLERGGKILVSLIEKKVKRSMVPPWPWGIVARIMAILPTAIIARAFSQ